MALRHKFERQWGKGLSAALKVLQQDWEQTTTFFAYPPSQHKALRSTNIIERLFAEFRRRTKSIPSFPTAEAALQHLGELSSDVLALWQRSALLPGVH
jgi:transposase-like protein